MQDKKVYNKVTDSAYVEGVMSGPKGGLGNRTIGLEPEQH